MDQLRGKILNKKSPVKSLLPQASASAHFHEFSEIDSEQDSKSDPGLNKQTFRNRMNKPFVKNDISSIDSIETTERHTRIENMN